jgi:hypothetical protein
VTRSRRLTMAVSFLGIFKRPPGLFVASQMILRTVMARSAVGMSRGVVELGRSLVVLVRGSVFVSR